MGKGKCIDKIVSTIDIYPTLMELCGLELPYKTDGKSMVPLLNDPLFSQWENATYGYYRNGISLRTERYRLTNYFRDENPQIELYDLKTDPNETKNIAGENQDLVEILMPIWEKGNTGLFEEVE